MPPFRLGLPSLLSLVTLLAVAAVATGSPVASHAQEERPGRATGPAPELPQRPDPALLAGHTFGPAPQADRGTRERRVEPQKADIPPAPEHTRPTAGEEPGAAGIPVLPISFVSMNGAQTEIYFDGGDDTSSDMSMTRYYDGGSNLWYRFTDTGVNDLFPTAPCFSVSAQTADCPGNLVTLVWVNVSWGFADPDDDVAINDTAAPVTIYGGTGNDSITVGTGSLDFLPAVSIDGGLGTDDVTLYDGSNIFDDAYAINTNTISRPFFGGAYLSNDEWITLLASQGHNAFNVNGSPQGLAVYGGGGDDVFTVTSLDYLGGFTLLSGDAGLNTVAVDDQFNPYNDNHYVYGDSYYRDFSAGFTYYAMDVFNLRAQDTDGDVYVYSSAAGTPISIDAGTGSDIFYLGQDLSFMDSLITVYGGADPDIDQLVLGDGFGGSASWAISSYNAFHSWFAGVDWSGVDAIEIQASSFADDFGVYTTAGGQQVNIEMGGGDDTLFAGTGDLDYLGGPLSVNGNAGADSATLIDDAVGHSDNYDLTYDSVVRPFFGGFYHAGLEQLALHGQPSDNSYFILPTSYGTPTEIFGNDGADAAQIGFNLQTMTAPVTFRGGTGTDMLLLSDNSGAAPAIYHLAAGAGTGDMSRNAVPLAIYDGSVETAVLEATPYNDGVVVGSTLGGVATWVYAGEGSDHVSFQAQGLAATGSLNLNGGGHVAGDTLFIYSGGAAFSDDGSQIQFAGKQPVNYVLFEIKGEGPAVDADGDGCSNTEEVGGDEEFGGRRNPLNGWDFYDVTLDQRIDLSDTLLILEHFGHYLNDPADYALDRYAPHPGQPWRTEQSLDGIGVDLTDALISLDSFGHDCTAP